MKTSREKRVGQMLVDIMGRKDRQVGTGGAKKTEEWGWNLKINGPKSRESCEGQFEAN